MTDVAVVLAFTVAGFATGWFARGGVPSRRPTEHTPQDPAQDVLADLTDACDAARADPSPATRERLRAVLARADQVDEDFEQRLGADDPSYRDFEAQLNALISLAHRLDAPRIEMDVSNLDTRSI